MEGSWQTNGGQQSACDNQQQPSSSREKLRMPTVHEALPFTPLSSIVPFSPDMIHPPTAAPVVQPTAFSNHDEVNRSKALLDQLSAGATSAESASLRCQQSIRDVQRLLDPGSLTALTFSRPPQRQNDTSTTTESTNKQTAASLSPFARMVLDNTSPQFQYLTPERSPEPSSGSSVQFPKKVPAASLATPQSFVKPANVTANGQATSTSAAPPSSSQHRQVSAVMPQGLSAAQCAEYQSIPDQDSSAGAQYLTPSKPPTSSATRSNNVPHRARSDKAVMDLQNILTDYLQKQDQMQPDTSGQVSADAVEIFELRDTQDGSKPVLRPGPQSKLESVISTVVSCDRLPEIDLHDLQQALRLCELPIAAIDSLNLSIGEDWSEQDTEEWVQQISLATHGLSAGRTLAEIMAGCAQLKEMQSEEYLNQVIDALMAITERCIIPLAEDRPVLGEKTRGDKDKPPSNPRFAIAFNNRPSLQILMKAARTTLRSLGKLLVKIDIEDSMISRVEYLCKSIIFAESATNDKDTPLGPGRLQELREVSMDVYARIFTKYNQQRDGILKDVLTSLEKLPATKQGARQYQLSDAKPIQLVSALLMRLVQTSATRTAESSKSRQDEDAFEEEPAGEEDSDDEGIRVTKKSKTRPGTLLSIVQPLQEAASVNAQTIVQSLINRALSTSKSSDEPYRKLLDIFTEDFLNVLGSYDWPASELLIRTLVSNLLGIVRNRQSAVLARTLALELLGVIGSGIIELQMSAKHAVQSIEEDGGVAERLKGLMQQAEDGSVDMGELVALGGPYRIWAEYLNEMGADEKKPLLQSAHGYTVMQWASIALDKRQGSIDSGDGEHSGMSVDLQSTLKGMLLDPRWLDNNSSLNIGTSVGHLAVLIVTLNSKLCRAFPKILETLLKSIGDAAPRIKSCSLKSVNILLEKDPTMLDRYQVFLKHIYTCLGDESALVRDSALSLLQQCIMLRPKLDGKVYGKIIERTRDNNTGVRNRAMKMLKDLYLRNPEALAIRSAVAEAIMRRLEDPEEKVSDLARTMMEEVGFQPFHGMKLGGDNGVKVSLALRAHAALLIATVDPDDRLLALLENLVKAFTTSSKAAKANIEVCRTMITVLFDGIIDNTEIPGTPAQSSILRSLTVFAKATPTLFTASQIEHLEPYTKNLTKTDELEIFRYVVTTLRYVMPHLTRTMKNGFLQSMQSNLLTGVTKLQKTELREVAPCLWTINGLLRNIERLVNFMVSVLLGIHKDRQVDPSDVTIGKRVSRLMVLASEFGNACDFEAQLATFKAKFAWYKGDSVSGLIVEILCHFTSPKQPVGVRSTAVDGMCTVAQAWPKLFLRADVTKAVDLVFADQIPEVEVALLAGLEGFFLAQEAPDDDANGEELPAGIASGTERLTRTYVGTDNEGASTSLAQRCIADVLRIALASCSEPAFVAARLVVSVNKQGLVHPNQSGPALVALETCPNKAVASAAFKEHKIQHQKHESLFDKEYMGAVQKAFEYQSKVVDHALGFTEGAAPSAKLHLMYEVLKAGKAQVRKKFLSNMVQKMNFDPAKLVLNAAMPPHLAFVRFCCENLALFDYDKVEDLLHLLTSLGKVFSDTGSTVAQAIESDVLKMQVDSGLGSEGMVNGMSDVAAAEISRGNVDPRRLRQLCVAAQIITIIEETKKFLTRDWNMHKHLEKKKGKDKAAEKTPTRSNAAPELTKRYLDRIREIMDVDSDEVAQRVMCTAFVDLITTDADVKVNSDYEANIDMDEMAGYDTPSESSGPKSPGVGATPGGKGRKRKASVSAAGTPRKRGRPMKSVSFNNTAECDDEGGWD